jgi:hypothetical protein
MKTIYAHPPTATFSVIPTHGLHLHRDPYQASLASY